MVASNGKLYAIGGISESAVLATVEEFDPSTNSWGTRAPMPTARHSMGLGSIAEKLYVIGGSGTTGVPLQVVEQGNGEL